MDGENKDIKLLWYQISEESVKQKQRWRHYFTALTLYLAVITSLSSSQERNQEQMLVLMTWIASKLYRHVLCNKVKGD